MSTNIVPIAAPVAKRSPEQVRRLLAFYVGVPIATAIIFGLNHSGLARHLPVPVGVLYWTGMLLPYWLVLDVASRAAALATRKLAPPSWVVLLSGAVLGMSCFAPLAPIYASVFAGQFAPGVEYTVQNDLLGAFTDLNELAKFSGVPLYWVTVNLVFLRLTGMPSYLPARRSAQENPRPADQEHAEQPQHGIVQVLPVRLRGEVLWMRAEDHYVRVCTARGEALVRYRFSDAVRELRSSGGFQVHRSFWVHRSFIERVIADRDNYFLRLRNGEQMRVSRPYIGLVRAFAEP